jgi:hypothetical protein
MKTMQSSFLSRGWMEKVVIPLYFIPLRTQSHAMPHTVILCQYRSRSFKFLNICQWWAIYFFYNSQKLISVTSPDKDKTTSTMKFSIAASLLLSAPVIAYTPNNFNSKTSLNKPSSSALRYVDPSAEDEVHVFGLAEVDLTSALSIKEDRVTAALAVSLGVSDDDVRFEYANWMMRYNKPADETRYTTFKKNILLQAQYNREHGQNFSLNEYGDLTEGKFRTWIWLLPVSSKR